MAQYGVSHEERDEDQARLPLLGDSLLEVCLWRPSSN